MSNDFYTPSGWPQPHAAGSSAQARAELASIQAGFDKLPALTGNANKYLRVNSGATAVEAVNTIDYVTIGGTSAGPGTFTTLAVAPSSGVGLTVTGAAAAYSASFTSPANYGPLFATSSGNGGIALQANAGTIQWVGITDADDALQLGGTGATFPGTGRISISTAGNVTINAPDSGDALAVAGTVEVSGSGSAINLSSTSGAVLNFSSTAAALQQINFYSSSAFELVGRTAGAPCKIYTNNTLRATVLATGGLVIAAPTSGYGLNIPSGTPATAGDTGTAGDVAWDSSYLYVCIDTNTWKRAAIATW
jgi:hypothetical protein